MSGGKWEYRECFLREVVNDLEFIKDMFNSAKGLDEEIDFTVEVLEIAYDLIHTWDYYLESDIGKDELIKIIQNKKKQILRLVVNK